MAHHRPTTTDNSSPPPWIVTDLKGVSDKVAVERALQVQASVPTEGSWAWPRLTTLTDRSAWPRSKDARGDSHDPCLGGVRHPVAASSLSIDERKQGKPCNKLRIEFAPCAHHNFALLGANSVTRPCVHAMNTMRKTLQGDREDTNALDTPSKIGPDPPEVFPTVRSGRGEARQVTIRVRNVARTHPSIVHYFTERQA